MTPILWSISLACLPDKITCRTGQTRPCVCSSGSDGQQACDAQGSGWLQCICNAPSDAGISDADRTEAATGDSTVSVHDSGLEAGPATDGALPPEAGSIFDASVLADAGDPLDAGSVHDAASYSDSTHEDASRDERFGDEGPPVAGCRIQLTPEADDSRPPDAGDFEFLTKVQLSRWGLVRFGDVDLFERRTQAITVRNVGTSDCVIREITWRQPWTPLNEFAMAEADGQPMTLPVQVQRRLAPGESAVWIAVFEPTRAYAGPLMPDMRCLDAGYCAHRLNTMQTEQCQNPPCQWGNGIDIVTGDGVDPLTQDTLTDQSALPVHTPGTFSVGFMGRPPAS